MTRGTAKGFRLGTHRIHEPEETWERIRGLLPLAGISRVADVTALDRIGIPVWQAVRPASRNLSVSQGKGATPAAAKVSAAMEALELWHAEDLSRLPRIDISLREMRSASPIPLESLRWASGAPVPDAARIPWVPARAPRTGAGGWLPRAMLELDFRVPLGLSIRPFNISSNGLASGNCFEEALLHAVCELVERHGAWLAHQEPARRTMVDPETVDEPSCREMVERFRAAGLKLAIQNLTWEAGLPVLQVDAVAPDIANIWRGSGCHTSPAVALSRALTEAAQSRLTFISGARDDLPAFVEGLGPYEAFIEPEEGRSFAGIADFSTDSVADDLARVLDRLAAMGLEVWAVDLTREEIGVSVVAAFIPGLRELPHGAAR
ncbi:MAG TPA: YcaO-like family protein [Thermoanaerobaculia bacterium]|nr:YcaO-like family protein [Thermoanaerobaculia bacterium]